MRECGLDHSQKAASGSLRQSASPGPSSGSFQLEEPQQAPTPVLEAAAITLLSPEKKPVTSCPGGEQPSYLGSVPMPGKPGTFHSFFFLLTFAALPVGPSCAKVENDIALLLRFMANYLPPPPPKPLDFLPGLSSQDRVAVSG